jgi:hypothetical protein
MGRSFLCVLAGTLLLYDYKETSPGICEHLYEPARGIQELAPDCHTITKPPLGIYKYLYRPARGIRAGTWLLYNYKPLWYLRIPLRARQRNIELAPHCYTELAPHCRILTNMESLTLLTLSIKPTVTRPLLPTTSFFDPLYPLMDVLSI